MEENKVLINVQSKKNFLSYCVTLMGLWLINLFNKRENREWVIRKKVRKMERAWGGIKRKRVRKWMWESDRRKERKVRESGKMTRNLKEERWKVEKEKKMYARDILS